MMTNLTFKHKEYNDNQYAVGFYDNNEDPIFIINKWTFFDCSVYETFVKRSKYGFKFEDRPRFYSLDQIINDQLINRKNIDK